MTYDLDRDWKKPVIRIGRWTLWIAVAASFFPALYLMFFHGVVPEGATLLKAWLMVAGMFGMLYLIEPVTYFSVLGLSGIYLAMLSGNVGNMRVPCSMMGLEATRTEPGTPRAEIVSTLAITGSIISNLVLLTAMAFVGTQALALMPPSMVKAFQLYTIPAVYGAMFVQSAIKNPRLVPFGVGIPMMLMLLGIPGYLVTFITVLIMIAISRFFYLRDRKKTQESAA